MKRTKNFFALILALMMAFSCMVMPAMAAADDEIMPLGLKGYCTVCNREVDYQTYKDANHNTWYKYYCATCGVWREHKA